MNNRIKKEEMVNNNNQPHNIKTPQNVEEFRTNLKKYYMCLGDNNDELYVRNCDTDGINVNDINSLSDLYQRCSINFLTPSLIPKVNQLKEFLKFMKETNQIFSTNGYFLDENNYEVIEDNQKFILNYNPVWIGLDNKIYREFFYLTLGDFSGYVESDRN